MEKYVNTARRIDSDHVAESGVRAVSLCMMLRQAAGNAAFLAIQAAKKHKKPFSFRNDSVQAVMMVAPMMIGFILFTYVPIIYLVRCSFFSSNGFKEKYIALQNFERIFLRDPDYWRSVVTTFILAFGKLAVQIPLALFLAVLLNKGLKATAIYRVTLFLPALQTVPDELYECAAMDGITPVKEFFSITLPMIGRPLHPSCCSASLAR